MNYQRNCFEMFLEITENHFHWRRVEILFSGTRDTAKMILAKILEEFSSKRKSKKRLKVK